MLRQHFCQNIWIKCRSPLFYIPVLLSLVLLYLLDMTQLDNIYSVKVKSNMNIDNGFLIKTMGCRIPYLDPFDKSILNYVYKVKPFNCGSLPPLVTSNVSFIYIEIEHLPMYNISNSDILDCYYQPFWRVNPTTNIADNLYAFGEDNTFTSSAKITDEFVKVVCKINGAEIYKDYFSFVPVKHKNRTTLKQDSDDDEINVLVIGLDSISRLNFQRQLPRTKHVLTQQLNAIELIGYNKVGDNTFPNLIPILTGLSVDELARICWDTTLTKFDNCPFIWKNFSRANYLTAYAEDSSWMGLFNYVKRGFKKQPTDYYWRTFNYLAEKEIGHNKPFNADLCIGPRPVYTILLNYIEKFVHSLKMQRYFGFFWGTSLSHDNLNYPGQGDTDYAAFFTKLQASLNNTVLIVLSDHGMRWGDIRSTHLGHLEERLPFLFFIFPRWFMQKFPTAVANLRKNSRRLSTPFDLHETLADLLNVKQLSSDNIRKRSYRRNQRGISLFLSIPANRTCALANISAHWCTCQKSEQIDKNHSMVVRGADFIVAYINSLLEGYNGCATLRLEAIIDSRLLKSNDYLKNNSTIHDYTIILSTMPGRGLFESTVRCVDCEKEDPFELTGTISRLNLYGNTSACVTDFHLKLYCYCGS